MKFKPELQAEIDEQGRLVLPKELLSRLGLKPGDKVPVSQGTHSISVHQPVTHLKKVYIEPTSQCNLTCRTCIRNTWSEPMGQMSLSTFNLAIESLRAFIPSPTIVFGGFGEPLFHPHIIDMIKKAKANGSLVELITNGTLLTEELARELLSTGIDVLWISLDGASPESYADVRHGAALTDVLANVSRLRYSSWASQYRQPHIGVVFVAMKSTIADLPKVLGIGQQLLADRYIITNVLPYTKELCSEVLYSSVLGDISGVPSPWTPDLNFSKIDMNEITRDALYRVIRGWRLTHFAQADIADLSNRCPFIESGSIALSWDGNLSPCLPLMHTHGSYLHDRKRFSRRHVVGNVTEHIICDVWNNPDYVKLRQRVQAFDFSPCTFCGGCDLSEANEEDCFGNVFPTCGGCLWAQGIIQCP